ncbi:MAG: zinc-binding dehydrogenase [Gemmatimonadota bacterium]|nr:zinc-binding dehydrogenase [Gemmatimonadota bacterium]
MSKRMKALVLRGHGDLSQLAVDEVPAPVIRGPGEVRIRLEAAALNHLDLWTIRGLPGLALALPHILGGDGAGVVDSVGNDVEHVQPGDRVMLNPGISCSRCRYCLRGEHSLCETYRLLGEHVPGTLAEYIVVPEQNVAAVPTPPGPHPPISWAEAAAFSLVTLTAWRMLVTRAHLRAGETVLIWGVGGGVSVTALQVAKLCGARVIVTSSSDAKLEAARALGADETLNHGALDIVKSVRRLTDRRGVDVVVDNVGEATWDRSLKLLARGGRLVTCGATTGPAVNVDVRRLFWYQWTILGSTMGGAEDFREAVNLLGQGRLRPVIDSTFALDDAVEAFRRLEQGEQMGKITVAV